MTGNQLFYIIPLVFPVFFAAMWIGVTSLLGFLSGWFTLMQQYPDRDEKPLVQLNWQSGFMGSIGVNFRNVLRFGVCPSGLRVGLFRPFGLFCRDFFVPWRDVTATPTTYYFWNLTQLDFGRGVGLLRVYPGLVEKLNQAAHGWPEIGKALQHSNPPGSTVAPS